jgi:hypothetical protein
MELLFSNGYSPVLTVTKKSKLPKNVQRLLLDAPSSSSVFALKAHFSNLIRVGYGGSSNGFGLCFVLGWVFYACFFEGFFAVDAALTFATVTGTVKIA